ncbi:macro domain-containing protein [Vibrio harveyi]|uniref:macro domain-containing protein n=1 Tax=Vibrio harveyi TaxID=669 RepID=UPI003CEA4B1C
MSKVAFFDKALIEQFQKTVSAISMILSLIIIFIDIPNAYKLLTGIAFIVVLIIVYFVLWIRSNNLKHIDIDVEGSQVIIKEGDIFVEEGLKAIAFNDYFDTQVDNVLIAKKSLNGIFIENYLDSSVELLDKFIDNDKFVSQAIIGENPSRVLGKKIRYKIGTICLYGDYLLTSFAKFDDSNKAILTMPEYLEFLINFWDQVNSVYAQQSVSVPIFGSGITRIKGHKTISDEDLLKIMLWTFRISEMRFKYPAKLSIIVHKDKMKTINLFDIKSSKNGI